MGHRTWAALALLIAAAAAPTRAQEPDTLSNREMRQRIGFAIARARNAIDEHKAELEHLLIVYAAADARVRADSLAELGPGTAPAPDPEPGAYLFRDGFESGGLSHDENGMSWGGSKNVSVTDRVAHSGEHALQFFYEGRALDRDGHAEQRFSLGRKVRELWVEYWIYYPDGTEGLGARYVHRSPEGPANNKFLAVWGGDYGRSQVDGAWVGFSTMPAGRGDSRFEAMGTIPGLRSPRAHRLQPVIPQLTDAHRGRWVRFRARFRLGTQGVVEGWLDDALIGRYAGPVGASDPAADYLDAGYLLGWANSGYSEDTYIFIDDVSFYTSDPGW